MASKDNSLDQVDSTSLGEEEGERSNEKEGEKKGILEKETLPSL